MTVHQPNAWASIRRDPQVDPLAVAPVILLVPNALGPLLFGVPLLAIWCWLGWLVGRRSGEGSGTD